MPPTWQFLVFPVLFVVSGCSERLAREMQQIAELHHVMTMEHTYLPMLKTLSYTFPLLDETACLSISGDESLFSEKFHQAASEHGGTPSIVILDRKNRFKCQSLLVVVDHAEGLRSTLKKIPLYPTNRIWCLVNQGTLDELHSAFQETPGEFGDANVIIFSFGQYDRALRIEQPERVFEKIEIPENGTWPSITNHIRAFSGMKIRYTTANCDVHMTFNSSRNWGLDWKIFDEVARGMNLKPEFVELPPGTPDDDVFGTLENGTWKGGILENIATRKADIGFCGFFLDSSKFRGSIEMGNPIRAVRVNYAVRRPKPNVEDSWTVVFASFSDAVYAAVLVSLVTFATTIHSVASSEKIFGSIPQGYKNYGYCLTSTWGLMLQGYCTSCFSKMGVLRRFILMWSLFSLLFSCSFSSHLVSNFTRPPFTPKPRDLEELVKMGYSAPMMMSFPMEFVLDVEDPIVQKWLDSNYNVNDWDHLLNILMTDKRAAILGQIFDGRPYFMPYTPNAVPDDVLDLYETMDSCISYVYEAFAFRRGSPFRIPINEYVLNLARFGLLKKYNDDILTEVSLNYRSVKFVLQKSASVSVLRPLSMFHLKGVFLALIIGLILSVVAFIGELVCHCYQATHTPDDIPDEAITLPIITEFFN